MTDNPEKDPGPEPVERDGITDEDAALARLAAAELARQADVSREPYFHGEFVDWNGTALIDGTVNLVALARTLALGVLHLPDDPPSPTAPGPVMAQHGIPARYSIAARVSDTDGTHPRWADLSGNTLTNMVCWWSLPQPLSLVEVDERIAMASEKIEEGTRPEPVDEPYECPKCGALSGDSWSNCDGSCPIVGSPYYNAATALRGILRRSYNRDK